LIDAQLHIRQGAGEIEHPNPGAPSFMTLNRKTGIRKGVMDIFCGSVIL
jgi:hypothetical protein